MNKKIDIYTKRKFVPRDADGVTWEYAATTSQAKTCKQAKQRFCQVYGLDNSQVKASFRK